jgi:hypothetical protein
MRGTRSLPAAALSMVVMLAGCGGSSALYHQGRTAACLEKQGFVVRYGPRPVDVSVFEEQTGGSRLRLGVFRFYGSSGEADDAAEASPRQFKDTYRNVLAYGWYLPRAAATDCLQSES